MRRYVVDVSTLFNVFVEHASDASGGQTTAAAMQENGVHIAFRLGTFGEEQRPRILKIVHQRLQSMFVKRHDPLAFSLTHHANHTLAEIDVGEIYADKFADANSGRVEKFRKKYGMKPEPTGA